MDKLIPYAEPIVNIAVHDIALIRLKEDIQFNKKVQPITLPTSNFVNYGTAAKLTGWGRTDVSSLIVNI